jgi:transcriptional regulator with XRE-family HTH domain
MVILVTRKSIETFGQRVRRLRQEKGISLRQFAYALELSATYVSQVERDEQNPPVETRLKDMAKVLGVDIDELIVSAGRVPNAAKKSGERHSEAWSRLYKSTKGLSEDELIELARIAEKFKQ